MRLRASSISRIVSPVYLLLFERAHESLLRVRCRMDCLLRLMLI